MRVRKRPVAYAAVKLPALRYWFSNAALASAGVVLIGLLLSLVQVMRLLPDWAIWLLEAVSVVLIAVVWHTGAQQAQDAAIDQKNSAAILENLSSLVTARQERDDPIDWGKLSDLSNAQLRAAALSLASQMRVFEASHREREDLQRAGDMARRREALKGLTTREEIEEQGNAIWDAERLRDDASSAARGKVFATQYLPKAIAVRDELFARQGIVGSHGIRSPYHSVALDRGGLLAGVNPIGEAATAIERLARTLP
jgi:hypothetical protein